MISRNIWTLLSIDLAFTAVIACYPQQAITSDEIQSSIYTSPITAQSQQLYRSILRTNLQQYVGAHNAYRAPGIAAGLVTEQGDIVLGLGRRNIQYNQNVNRDTLFGIGSISKLFVGMALAKAVVDGDLKRTTLANDWLDMSLQVDSRIRLGHLVTHRSGLPRSPSNLYSRPNAPTNPFIRQVMPALDYNKENLANCLRQNGCRPISTPGSQHLYSNLGIGILSIALQNRYGYNNSNTLIRGSITGRLNMDRTNMKEPAFLNRYRSNLAQGYRYNDSTSMHNPVPLSDMGILDGSGELISTVNDMNRLLKVLTGLEPGPLGRAAEEMNRPLMATSQNGLRIGYAHQIRRFPDGSELHWKDGGTAGFTAVILWQTEPKIGLVLLANRGNLTSLKNTGMSLIRQISQQLD